MELRILDNLDYPFSLNVNQLRELANLIEWRDSELLSEDLKKSYNYYDGNYGVYQLYVVGNYLELTYATVKEPHYYDAIEKEEK